MKPVSKSWALRALALALSAPLVALAQSRPGEIPRPDTYQGSKALQEQQQRDAEAARKAAQDQSDAYNRQFNQNMNQSLQRQQQAYKQGQAQGTQLEAARQAWQKRPPLPAEQNPLIGARWTRPPTGQGKSQDPFAAMAAMMKGGICDVLFGGGTFEFRPNALVGFDARTPPQELDKVEYRGDAKHVVVIPKTTVRLMEFDVESPDRIKWSAQNCVLVRAGAAGAKR